jgi:hypothetical protein
MWARSLPSAQSVLGVVQYDARVDGAVALRSRVAELRRLYEPAFGDEFAVAVKWLPEIRTGVVTAGYDAGDELQWPLVWGVPLDHQGFAAAPSVGGALANPLRGARDLTGYFVIAGYSRERLRLCTSPTLTHTLKRVRGAHATAWATRGWAALVLAGEQPALNEDAVADFIILGYTLRSDELLAGSVVLPDASVVDIDASGYREWNYWPLAERVTTGPETTAAELREAIRTELVPVLATDGARLGLTAGRDSTLLASCAVEAGIRVGTFTFGKRWSDDVAGARAAARAIHVPHQVVDRTYGGLRWQRMAELSVWTEGLQAASALLDPTNLWGARSVRHVVGSGAEIGRAFYYKSSDPGQWFNTFVTDVRERMAATAAETLIARLDADMTELAALGCDVGTTVDLLYATRRMGKWLLRELPSIQIRDVLPAYLTPRLVGSLLNIAPNAKRSGAIFAEAHMMAPVNLHSRATAAAGRFKTVRARLGRRSEIQAVHEFVGALQSTPHASVTAQLLGHDWLMSTLQRARTYPYARQHAWQLLAVEALFAALQRHDLRGADRLVDRDDSRGQGLR